MKEIDKNNPNIIDYKTAGVDIEAGNTFVDQIKSLTKATHSPSVLGALGGFAGFYEMPTGLEKPILVACTDGVGTKLNIANQLNQHDTIGIDLVAMCVNDLIVSGAKPLFFLDYLATGKLDINTAKSVVVGIAEGCKQAGCSLIGGETAEMPGMYQASDYDLAGFSVGVVDKKNIIDGSQIKAKQQIIGLASSGIHSNGYSLIRALLKEYDITLDEKIGDKTLGQCLIEPTKIYVNSILSLLENYKLSGIAHITGGGLYENIPRILPQDCCAVIDTKTWEMPELFNWVQEKSQLDPTAMMTTFNCGIGMVIIVDEADTQAIMQQLEQLGETAFHMGEIIPRTTDDCAIIINQ